ncbi:hypothetical protein GCM10009691_26200 [Brevibacterium picturae]|uniref:Uncharacterized protein n=1 Tax=Brevibacterium picturae TaxID=260553 RepID=A0ABN2C1A1_9MICO
MPASAIGALTTEAVFGALTTEAVFGALTTEAGQAPRWVSRWWGIRG